MSTEQGDRNLATYILGDNPCRLAEGVVPEMAGPLGVAVVGIDGEPNFEEMSRLVSIVDSKAQSYDRPKLESIWPLDQAAELVKKSGIHLPLNRSLWTPEISTPSSAVRIVLGGGARRQDRMARLLARQTSQTANLVKAVIAVGDRSLELEADEEYPNVLSFQKHYGTVPTDATYAEARIRMRLLEAGYEVRMYQHDSEDSQSILGWLFDDYTELPSGQLASVQPSGAGIWQACQMRAIARVRRHDFDADPQSPQQFVMTDRLPVAENEDELQRSDYQDPYESLYDIAATGLYLARLAIESRRR